MKGGPAERKGGERAAAHRAASLGKRAQQITKRFHKGLGQGGSRRKAGKRPAVPEAASPHKHAAHVTERFLDGRMWMIIGPWHPFCL